MGHTPLPDPIGAALRCHTLARLRTGRAKEVGAVRVLHVNKFLYRKGGAEGYMEDVAALQVKAGHEVAYWGMAHPENTHTDLADTFVSEVDFEDPSPGLAARAKVVGRMLWSTSARAGIERAVERFRPDVAHLHNVYHQLSPSILGALSRQGVPIVLTLHDYKLVCPTYHFLDKEQVCEACLTHKFWNAPLRRCRDDSALASGAMALETTVHTVLRSYRHVGVFICPSEFMARKMAEGRVYPDRMHVLRHFVDLTGTATKERAGGEVLVAGRLVREKAVDTAVRAIALVPGDVRLHIAGDGPMRADLERLAAEVAPGRVLFHGRLPKDDLHELLRSSCLTLVPSRWYENQPLAVLESMANGVPVVATDLGGTPELVRPGVDGELVPADQPAKTAEAIASLLADPDRALLMGQAGRKRIEEEFSPEDHLAGLDRLYQLAGA
jgi:glycosyltransferase involved in cell wall biosynthesis